MNYALFQDNNRADHPAVTWTIRRFFRLTQDEQHLVTSEAGTSLVELEQGVSVLVLCRVCEVVTRLKGNGLEKYSNDYPFNKQDAYMIPGGRTGFYKARYVRENPGLFGIFEFSLLESGMIGQPWHVNIRSIHHITKAL